MNFFLKNLTSARPKKKEFEKMKDKILGKEYDLSAVFLKEKEMEQLHKHWLKKNGATTVISFPLSPKSGEIFLCPPRIMNESKKYKIGFNDYFKKIFIHGLLHLKRLNHGKKMEQQEEKFLKL